MGSTVPVRRQPPEDPTALGRSRIEPATSHARTAPRLATAIGRVGAAIGRPAPGLRLALPLGGATRIAPRLAHVWALLPIAFAFCYAASIPIQHSDLFYTLLNGRLMVQLGQVPLRSDPFTYAPASPDFYDQPWLAQLVFLAAQRLGGYPAISFVHALAIAAAIGLLGWLVRRSGARPPLAAGLTLLALVLSATSFNIRPQSLAYLPFVGCLALARLPAVSRPGGAVQTLGMLLLSAAWANLHGSFPLAVLLVVAHTLGALIEDGGLRTPRARQLVWLSLAAGLGSLLTPAGPRVWSYAWSVGADPTVRHNIEEWWPTTPATLTGQLFLGTLPLILVGLVAVAQTPRDPSGSRGSLRRQPGLDDLLLLAGLLALAVTTQRAVVWWGLASGAVLARRWAAAGPSADFSTVGRCAERPALNALLLGLVLGLMTLSLPWLRPFNPLLTPELRTYLSADHPTQAVAFLDAHLAPMPTSSGGQPPRIFARMEWGGYLAWALWPRARVFLDARIEHHPPEVWRDYFSILAAQPGWDTLLDRYGADYLLIERQPFPELVRAVEGHPAWRRIYADDLSLLYVRAQ